MAIVQISKITQRSGNIVDLPQLDNAELGWAADARQLFIGNDNNITGVENVEVLTSYSTIDFDQLNGASGNLDIDGANLANGQIFTYNGNNWTNRGGNVGGLINLGEVSNVKLGGGAIGYVLQTDGTGNLSWAPKTTITAFIQNATQVNSPNTTVTNTTVTTNIITVGNSASFSANTAVYFTSAIGGLVANSTYYIRNNVSSTQVTVSTTLGGGNVTLSTASGSLTMRKVELQITTTENNDLVKGQQVTITNVPVMTPLNGNSFYANVLTSNTFSLYTDIGLTIPVNSVTYGTFPYSSVTATSSSTDQVTVGDATPFTVNDPVIFVGNTDQSNSGIIAGQVYYVLTKDTSAPNTWITLSETVGGSTLQLGNSTVTANVFTSGGRAVATISGSGSVAAAGSNTTVQYNNNNIMAGDSDFTWNFSGAKVLTINGNANVGNLNSTATVSASRLISNIATGTAPMTVTSTTRVANLNVNYANVSDFEVVTTQTTGLFYPVFVSGSTTGNYSLASNSNISFNAATGNLSATIINATGNANVGNLGTTGLITATGNITGGNLVTTGNANVGNLNSAGLLVSSGNANIGGNINLTNSLYLGNTTEVLTRTAYNSTNFSKVFVRPSFDLVNSGNINSADVLAFNSYISGANSYTSTTNPPPYVLNHADNLATGIIVLPVDILAYSVGSSSPGTVYITGGNSTGNGVSSYVRVGEGTSDPFGIVLKSSNTSITGNISASGNITPTSYFIRSIATGLSANGSTQGTATVLSKEFNGVSTGTTGQGVLLPVAVPGMSIVVNNTTGSNLLVYPSTGAVINTLGVNAGYTHVNSATLQYVAFSSTQWYTVGATYA